MLHILPSERQPDDIMEVNKMELIPGGKYAYPYLVGCKTVTPMLPAVHWCPVRKKTA